MISNPESHINETITPLQPSQEQSTSLSLSSYVLMHIVTVRAVAICETL